MKYIELKQIETKWRNVAHNKMNEIKQNESPGVRIQCSWRPAAVTNPNTLKYNTTKLKNNQNSLKSMIM